MRLRAQKAEPSVAWSTATNELVRAMTHRMYGLLAATVAAAAMMFAATETFARPAGMHGGRFASSHPMFRPVSPFRHHRRNNGGIFWPADGYYYGPNGEPIAEPTQSASGDIHYTFTNDVPWDWAHRYPPQVTPSDQPYVSNCPTEIAKVFGRDGREQTVNITRCY